ncbi:hypothetical protein HBI06_075850 [Parastagonospora nodorum]|nr:hypothetical protein HBI06_075850 [Parastagonospora nodorum]KAH4245962.1 hypothetical protein HBI05_059070 [Parastagonospora nodorum]
MLAESKIDSLDTHLEQFKLNNRTSQNDLQNLLKEYGQLLEDYKDLKKAFESKSAKPVAKYAATPVRPAEKPRSPYVLVLVDGDGYIFNDELIRDKEEGGMRAARMLNEAVEKYLHQSVPEARNLRIVVRIYADLTNLSKQLARSKLTGLEKRSLGAFSAAFTRAMSSFDFVDALDEEGTKFKIREQFRVASEDSACSHILYAACHDSAYLSQLVPHKGQTEKITLVQGTNWSPEFYQFNLTVTQFPTVFRWLSTPTIAPTAKAANGNGSVPSKAKSIQNKSIPHAPSEPRQNGAWGNGGSSSAFENGHTSNDRASSVATSSHDTGYGKNFGSKATSSQQSSQQSSKQPCRFFQKGSCRFGTKCEFQHVPPTLDAAGRKPSGTSSGPSSGRSNISSSLPTTISSNYIPLNKDNQRIDTYIRPPTQAEWSIYNSRFHKQKPCNSFHLQRVCTTFGCPYNHQELEPESRHVLEYVVKCSPCPKKGDCRDSNCPLGHICQKDGCQGQMKGCRMKSDLHNVHPELANMVLVDEEDEMVHGQEQEMPVSVPDDDGYLW